MIMDDVYAGIRTHIEEQLSELEGRKTVLTGLLEALAPNAKATETVAESLSARGMNAAKRQAISIRMKRYWAAKRKAGKK